jgi:tRNA(fMet)-specific endonuclease VapC
VVSPRVFDSSALILYLNDALAEPAVALLRQAIVERSGLISAITRAEVLAWPAHTPQSLKASSAALAMFELCIVDQGTADEAARIRREYGLKLPDALIAATATLRGLPVITANVRDFERVASLEVVRI